MTYHGLCGIIFGQGLKEEIDLPLNFDAHSRRLATSFEKSTVVQRPPPFIESDLSDSGAVFESSDGVDSDFQLLDESSEDSRQLKLLESDLFSKHQDNSITIYSDFVMNKDRFLFTSKFNWQMNG